MIRICIGPSRARPYQGTGINVSIPGVRNSKMSAKITLRTHRP
jgi:hypothetical protein